MISFFPINKIILFSLIAVIIPAAMSNTFAQTMPEDNMENSDILAGPGYVNLQNDVSHSGIGEMYSPFLPLAGFFITISALFLTPYFILKRKNIPSRPYLAIILSGVLLFIGIPYLISMLEVFVTVLSRPEEATTEIFVMLFVTILIPAVSLTIAGFLLYRSSIIRTLIKR